MSIAYALLGILSVRPCSGYDMKKIMQESPFMYWSGNNNQIYKALVELLEDGFVTNVVEHQEGSPSKKVYSITEEGLAELRRWTLAAPEAPEFKRPFLVQLAWTWQASNTQLMALLDQYAREVQGQLLIAQCKSGAAAFSPDRTPREGAVWALIQENVTGTYRHELAWIDKARKTLDAFDDPGNGIEDAAQNNMAGDESEMTYALTEKNGIPYLYLAANGKQIHSEQDGLDLISLCAQHGTNLLLIDCDRLSDDFFRLRTGVAGAVLQKFAQYNIKAAIVFDKEKARGKFKDFLLESNRGKLFRAYAGFEEAERWLLENE